MDHSDQHKLTEAVQTIRRDLIAFANSCRTADPKRGAAIDSWTTALDQYATYTESLRAAVRILLHKLTERGSVPGLLSEEMTLRSAYDGRMQVFGGAEPYAKDALFGELMALGLEDPETSEWPRALIKVYEDSLLQLRDNLTGHEVVIISKERYLELTQALKPESNP